MDFEKNNISTIVVSAISVVGSIASIYFAVKDNLGLAFIIVCSVAFLLLTFVLIFSAKYRKYRGYYRIRSELEILSEKLREYYSEFTDAERIDDVELSMQDVILQTLEHASRTLSKVTGKECTASLMMPNENNEFETIRYSTNAPTSRTRITSTPLPHDKGILSKAFIANTVVIWCLKKNRDGFEEIRKNFEEHYLSGMVCPIKVDHEAYAILNIDAKQHSVFGDSEKELGSFFSNILSCAFEVGESEWTQMHLG